MLAREGRKLPKLIGAKKARCGIVRGRWLGSCERSLGRSVVAPGSKGRGAQARRRDGRVLERSVKEARRFAIFARREARASEVSAKPKASAGLEEMAGTVRDGHQADPPAGAGRAGHGSARVVVRPQTHGRAATTSGQVQRVPIRIAAGGSDRAHQTRRPRCDSAGLDRAGQPSRGKTAAGTVADLKRLGISVHEVAVDGGFKAVRRTPRSTT